MLVIIQQNHKKGANSSFLFSSVQLIWRCEKKRLPIFSHFLKNTLLFQVSPQHPILLLCALLDVSETGHLDMFGTLSEYVLILKSSQRWKNSQTHSETCRITNSVNCWEILCARVYFVYSKETQRGAVFCIAHKQRWN